MFGREKQKPSAEREGHVRTREGFEGAALGVVQPAEPVAWLLTTTGAGGGAG